MRCPGCGTTDSRVVDSRGSEDLSSVRRRRECAHCRQRFTTFERVEELPLLVQKRDGDKHTFDRSKLIAGLESAATGRPIGAVEFEEIAGQVEEAARLIGSEVTSEWVGLNVLDRLRALDEVAALRFASVYKGFTEAADFERELRLIKHD